MARRALTDRIADQFSDAGERADLWRAFDVFLDTGRFLNLGYSERYQPTLLGSSQRRLVEYVGDVLAEHLPATGDVSLLDVGCGRGGPALRLAERYGFDVVGVDLVPYNVARARENAAMQSRADAESTDAAFLVGDATHLPLRPDSIDAATAIDSIVYVPDVAAVFAEIERVLRPGGVLVCSDLVAANQATAEQWAAVDAFADAWDMPPLRTRDEYERALDESGFQVRSVSDVTTRSVGRFRKWTTLYRWVADAPTGRLLEWLLQRYDLDPGAIDEQVRRAHDALPALRHVVVVAAIPE